MRHVFWIPLLVLSCVRPPSVSNEPGVLDLRNSDLSKPVELSGTWLSRPGLGKEMGPSVPYTIPAPWNVPPLTRGCGTLRLRVLLPAGAGGLALGIPDVATASRVLIDGHTALETGQVACAEEGVVARVKSQLLPLSAAETFDLEIQMANFADRHGGVWGPVVLGPHSQLERERQVSQGYEALLAGAMLLMGIYHLFLYAFRSSDRSPLHFGLFCLLIGLRSLLTGERWLLSALPDLPFWISFRLEYLTGYAAVPVFLHFFHRLYRGELAQWPRLLLASAAWPACIAVLVLPASYYTQTLPYFQIVTLLVTTYILCSSIFLAWKGNHEARLGLLGIVLLAACAVLDILRGEHIVRTGMFLPIALTAFLFLQSLILAARFARSFFESQSAAARLMAMDRLKDDFLSGISRELRTPLHGIIGAAEQLLAAGGPEQHRGLLETIRYRARSLNSLVQDILDSSRLRHNDIHLDRRPVSLYAAVSLVFDTSGALARRRRLELRNSVHADCAVVADEFRLQQVLFNLIGAAVQETEDGFVEVRTSENDGQVFVEVGSSGRALSANQSEPVDPDSASSSSISFWIAEALVELHGSRLEVTTIGGRRVFRFPLPQAERLQDIPDMAGASVDSFAVHDARQDALIFVVDDSEMNSTIVASALSSYSDVRVFNNAHAALDAVDRGIRPDLVLLDIMMPGMNGIEMCTELRKRFSPFELPVIFLSALETGKTVSLALSAGANDYITQPFEREELLARVRSQLLLGSLARENVAMARRELAMSRLIGQERARVYRDLHDGVASDLNTILMAVRMIRRTQGPSPLLDSIEKSALGGLGEIRDLVNTDDEGSLTFGYFSVWLQSQLREAARAGGMEVDVSFDRRLDDSPLPFGVSAHLKKICREIIQNTMKHAEATVLKAALKEGQGGFHLQIADNGRGFRPDEVTMGTGLRSMEKRAAECGLVLMRHSAPGSGTTYDIKIPQDLVLTDANHPNGGLTFFGTPS